MSLFSSHGRQIGSVRSEVRRCRAELPGRLPVASRITAIFSASGVFNFLPHIALFIVTPTVVVVPPPPEGVAVFVFISCYLFLQLSVCCTLPFQLSPGLGIGVKGGSIYFS